MGTTITLAALIAGVIGIFVGWNARTAYGANADLKVHKTRIPAFRQVRTRTGMRSVLLVLLTLLALAALVRAGV